MATKRRRRDPNTWITVRLPERALTASILHLAAPLLDRLGPAPTPDDARRTLALAIEVWNAHVLASPHWGVPDPRPLAGLCRTAARLGSPPELGDAIALLSERWLAEFRYDPRLVGPWSLAASATGRHDLVCETALRDGVRVEAPPPLEQRIALGGRFLDEVQICQGPDQWLLFPVGNHQGAVDRAGVATIHARMPTVVALFAAAVLHPVGGPPVEVMVGGQQLGPMVLHEVRCPGASGQYDVVTLVFHPANAARP